MTRKAMVLVAALLLSMSLGAADIHSHVRTYNDNSMIDSQVNINAGAPISFGAVHQVSPTKNSAIGSLSMGDGYGGMAGIEVISTMNFNKYSCTPSDPSLRFANGIFADKEGIEPDSGMISFSFDHTAFRGASAEQFAIGHADKIYASAIVDQDGQPVGTHLLSARLDSHLTDQNVATLCKLDWNERTNGPLTAGFEVEVS